MSGRRAASLLTPPSMRTDCTRLRSRGTRSRTPVAWATLPRLIWTCPRSASTTARVRFLSELHDLGGDPEFDRFPAVEELFLVYCAAVETPICDVAAPEFVTA
ncbi:hypothetical protein GCM10010245_80660 [Streptomyces spectabilis]|nr:hypothetical protein GCM10010245_80660 [Streptomyces spectabilis]